MRRRRYRAGSGALALVVVLFVGRMAGAETPAAGRGEEVRRHWAFAAPKRLDPPKVSIEGWSSHPIDRFIGVGLEEFGLSPAPEADRLTLLRRVTFDLTGLPPGVEEIEAFEEDGEPGAYERVVDRLLASPAYGERWAQHWLDLARYADTDGFEFDNARPGMWRYRDWVVAALNEDMPYNRFIALQMAGDEIDRGDPGAAIATGFHRTYADMVDLNDQEERRQNALNDITETTGAVFLGLTLGCARCHDHKTDPLKQSDFYRFQAIFSPARFVDDYDPARPVERAERAARLRDWILNRGLGIGTLISGTAAGRFETIGCVALACAAAPERLPGARVLQEEGGEPPPTYLRIRGEYALKGLEVEPGVPEVLSDVGPAFEPKGMKRSTGRRAALAAWLTSESHPLTTRVVVNRIWQHHFGRGIVETPSDFGRMGAEPTHPELLDWLSTELIACGWSLKSIHRLIVTSSAYRMSTRFDRTAAEVDPENELFWRQNRKRLDGEAIRDAMLAASGSLNREMGGPGVYPELPAELTRLSSHGAIWPVSPDPKDRVRRSLYIFVRRNLRYPFFEVFDRPDTNASCPKRPVTTIASQALTLINDAQTHRAAEALAGILTRQAIGEDQRIDLAYRRALGRPPEPDEISLVREFLRKAGENGWKDFSLALFNLNEFVYLD